MTGVADGESNLQRLEVILAAHGEAETAGFFENWRVGHRTLAHSAEVMHLPLVLRWLICTLGALRKRFGRRAGSPHNAWTRAQAEALATKLKSMLDRPIVVRAAFASATPSAEAMIRRPTSAGQRIFVSMSPSDSRLSCGLLCHARARAAGGPDQTRVLARLWDDPEFVALNVRHVLAACGRWPGDPAPAEPASTALVLVLHGTLIQDPGGRTPQFHTGVTEKTHFADAMQAALSGLPNAEWGAVVPAYLNHDVAGTWSQPALGAVLEDLAARGIERLWVFPCDFLVTGGEITAGLQQTLATGPIGDTRLLPCLNDSPHFIDYLAARVMRAVAEPHRRWQCDACPGQRSGA